MVSEGRTTSFLESKIDDLPLLENRMLSAGEIAENIQFTNIALYGIELGPYLIMKKIFGALLFSILHDKPHQIRANEENAQNIRKLAFPVRMLHPRTIPTFCLTRASFPTY
jgi:hypothetical protein